MVPPSGVCGAVTVQAEPGTSSASAVPPPRATLIGLVERQLPAESDVTGEVDVAARWCRALNRIAGTGRPIFRVPRPRARQRRRDGGTDPLGARHTSRVA